MSSPQIEALVRQVRAAHQSMQSRIAQLEQVIMALQARPRTITEEIDAIPGRRIEFVFSGEVEFDANDDGQRGAPITIQVSQDGPFVMTHYPQAIWRPSGAAGANGLDCWQPVSSFPLPTQELTPSIVDLAYEIQDGGNNRNFQNGPRGPLFSRPDNIVPLPVPTLFAANATIQFYPTYLNIAFNAGGGTAPTDGILHVDLIGYRIVNL